MKKAAGRRSFYAFFCLRAQAGAFRAPAASRCCACGRKLGRFVPRHEYLSFFVKRKVPKKTTQTYGLRTPWRGGEQVLRLRARDGEFRAPARVTFFFCKKKVTKENHLDLRSKDPLARGGQVQIWRCVLAGGVQRSSLSVKRTVPAFTGAEASATACPATVGAFASNGFGDYQIAPLPPQGGKGRCARRAQDIIIS